jgi:uncharacterized protein YcbX
MATAQDTRIDQLAERVERLEADVQALSAERQKVVDQAPFPATSQPDPAAHLWADKEMLRQASRRLLAELGIEQRPVDIYDLQRRMGEQLPNNELSRGIIEMRDE